MPRPAQQVRCFRGLWVLGLSLLGLLGGWQRAGAQAALQVVTTELGVTVAVPAALRQAPALAPLPDTSSPSPRST
ncbi:MAG TPA: hypothetical protein VG963_06800, partial [Polyangiaceae bacterium]|nr:hypothetical protein [Polyangiaceae bacterium]